MQIAACVVGKWPTGEVIAVAECGVVKGVVFSCPVTYMLVRGVGVPCGIHCWLFVRMFTRDRAP